MSQANSGLDNTRRDLAPEERRDGAAPRVTFETLVDVGAKTGGFEAESIDVSPDGIRMRTAYLPAPGERLTCRFDGLGGDVVATGEVAWCRDEGRGGEFGLRFLTLEENGARLLDSLCRPAPEDAPQIASSPEMQALIGSRVRLHIQGLGAPMRARVRDLAHGEVLVGSNLEFLRVGRDLELEDVEQGVRRVAMIEHVGVEIDPETNVPQLVVSLRYEDARGELGAARVPVASQLPAPATRPHALASDAATKRAPSDNDDDASVPSPVAAWAHGTEARHAHEPAGEARNAAISGAEDVAAPITPKREVRKHAPSSEGATSQAGTDDDIEGARLGAFAAVGRTLADFAQRLGPKLSTAGVGAKTSLAQLFEAVKRKRAAGELEQLKARAPKRTTAPPPSGALRSNGRRLFRDAASSGSEVEAGSADSSGPIPRIGDKKRATIGAIIGVVAVVGIYAGATQLSKSRSDSAASAAITESSSTHESSALADPSAVVNNAAGRGREVGSVDVPLFGATPLSTTEIVPAPPSPDLLGAAAPSDADAGTGVAAGTDAARDEGDEPRAKSAPLQKEWGVGNVKDAIALRLTMDEDVSGFSGIENDRGFTLTVPGRKSISSASQLARKDKRIDSVNVVNYPDRAEITVEFKSDVPAYLASVSGKRLTIEIAADAKSRGDDDSDDADAEKRSKKKSKRESKD
ncbi:MAG: hypothetical protein EXR75_15685, partial [Myxococcales bacterium]|nr:hypothetical protein [Myxococcales bacterium]